MSIMRQARRKSKMLRSTTTIYVTDADNREVLEYDGASGAVQRWYAFGQGPDEVLGQMNIAAGTRTTPIPDLQGSIIGTLDSGGVLTRIGYQPYGENPALTSGTYRYTARRLDPETAASASQPSGLYYDRARMYSPTWGRFLQPDPLGYAGGSNLYAYVGNDPLNRTDPSGNIGLIFTFGGLAEVGLSPVFAQAGGQASIGVAFLVDVSQWSVSHPLNLGASIVTFNTTGGTASALGSGVPSPMIPSNPIGGISTGGVIAG
ncbi:MAG TPA: RHS repeat-associated core domain-containing protein [Stellaceae bacterium]|jgi:RHS repeat-associated protein|nr:RHS repeat-associated core domain-containing protein [Stellaceae bacterium]